MLDPLRSHSLYFCIYLFKLLRRTFDSLLIIVRAVESVRVYFEYPCGPRRALQDES